MAKIIGTLPQGARRNLLGSVAARFSEGARLKAEREEGEGLRRLFPLLERLPESVTVVLQPTLGFMTGECCVVGPGTALVIQTLHFRGKITLGEKEEWLGQPGGQDLGRPDRRAAIFCEKLEFSGHARGFALEPVVICTDGPVQLEAPTPQAPLVAWEDATGFLAQAFPGGLKGFDPAPLIKLLGS
jgi:hypothetical protein